MAENIKSRKYYRVHNGTDWDRMHFVTDANSVDANDGDNMETKVGAIKGITTSTNVTEEGYAADATVVAALNDSLVAQDNLKFRFSTDGEGNYGYLGADDSFIPFKSGISNMLILYYVHNTNWFFNEIIDGKIVRTTTKALGKKTSYLNDKLKITYANGYYTIVANDNIELVITHTSQSETSVTREKYNIVDVVESLITNPTGDNAYYPSYMYKLIN